MLNIGMKVEVDNKPLYLAISAFLVSVIFTIAITLYLNFIINRWIEKVSTNIASSAISLTESRFNRYKLSYYGLIGLAKTLDHNSLDMLSATQSAKNSLDIFGEINFAAYVKNFGSSKREIYAVFQTSDTTNVILETTNEIEDKKFQDYLNRAFLDDRPVFYSRINSNSYGYIIGIIPVNAHTKCFYLINIGYDNLFYPVQKSNLLTNNLHLLLQAYDLGRANETPVYTSEDISKDSLVNRKSAKSQLLSKDLQLDGIKLKVSFTELKYDTIAIILRQIPFTAMVIGIIVGVMVFCVVFFTQLAYKMHH